MSSLKWDLRFLELARHVSGWSKDPSTKVGAVIVNDENIVVGLGYNGFARGVHDVVERLSDRPTKYAYTVHAELNAIFMAGDKAKGSTLYVYPTFMPPNVCHECCKAVIQSGIKEIVGYDVPLTDEVIERWGDSLRISQQMCNEAGVTYRGVK